MMSGPNMSSSSSGGLAIASASASAPTTRNLMNPILSNHGTIEDQRQEGPVRRPPLPLDTMRAYRACLNCRNRKSKCDLDINGGRPPCRRCQREARDCVLGESHRGGRRVKKPKLESNVEMSSPEGPSGSTLTSQEANSPTSTTAGTQLEQAPRSYQGYSNPGESSYSWQSASKNYSAASEGGQHNHFHENIASANLQNPADALEILAHVADQAEGGDSESDRMSQDLPVGPALLLAHNLEIQEPEDYIRYPPLQNGMLSIDAIHNVFATYQQFFHPYFPIIPRETFNRSRLPWLSRNEPHLFSAILTVASKDDERIHQICHDYMKDLICMLHIGAEAGVEAVEAMLLLSQWVSHRSQASVAVGKGEEDRVAWMHIGTAVRLGYYLGIDRTSFKRDHQEDPSKYDRARIVWLACYLCDRQVSVRLGKAFWSRGPGPLTGMKAADFPTLQPVDPGEEDRASIFQANLELTQIFSNCHDILYSSKEHGWKSMLEGRYAKYLDDFRAAIRNWNTDWGHLIGFPPSKPSLLLTYDYIRLYVNAFAYQATVARALINPTDKDRRSDGAIPLINSSAPDARFIYEALDAAKDLLQHFNDFIDVETLRYMPTLYYLYVVYSAVFLYKARATTTMSDDDKIGVRRIVQGTIDRLHNTKNIGSRYARLLQMLWRPRRKTTKKQGKIDPRLQEKYYGPAIVNGYDNIPQSQTNISNNSSYAPVTNAPMYPASLQNQNMNAMTNSAVQQQPQAFSWLDLDATWNFATQNGGMAIAGSDQEWSDDMLGVDGFDTSPVNVGYVPDMSFLAGGSEGLPF
ncbi:hypothetical protein BJ878DRAFT_501274 [Calycina marina]|uniref:Zn(2)-C6 fungal-type domain-containing protein n=1 Tax=Calycina marina TaxID=1763456 RepID=A0A9P7Z518_9HELO|nr:hypothetical protein BJ878DRAFT_501274 [Calycina marina]